MLWKSRAPLHGRSLTVRSLRVAAVASLAPWLLARAARARFAIPAPAAIAIAVLVFVVPATAALATSWGDNLRFAPWIDIGAGAAILSVGIVLAFGLRRRLPRRPLTRFAAAFGALGLAVGVLLPVSASESARNSA